MGNSGVQQPDPKEHDMKGSVFKRCVACNARVAARRCKQCGSEDYCWAFVVDIGQHPDGRRRQRRQQGFETKRAAEKALRELLHKIDTDLYVERSAVTVGRYLEDQWLPAVSPPNLRPSTWNSYASEIRRHVVPHLGGMRLQDVKPHHLNELYARLLREGRKDNRGGLSARTVRYVHVILHRALADAVRWGQLERNPAVVADPPRQSDVRPGGSMRTWSTTQLQRFLRHAESDRLSAAWVLLSTTGMRRGEVLGLRWTDVDLDAARLSVRQTYVTIDGAARFSEPKTNRSRRVIDLDPRTASTLREWSIVQAGERTVAGEGWADHDLVFARADGQPIDPDSFSKSFQRLSREAQLPRIRLHDLRHSHASHLLALGVNPKVASERLGHHSTAFTLDVYSHVVPGMQAEAANRVAGLVFEAEEAPTDVDPPPDDQQPPENVTES